MKKALFIFVAVALAATFSGGSVLAITVDTNLMPASAGGEAPIVKVKWEMNGPYYDPYFWGTDDSSQAGAQFHAPGIWEATKTVSFCAVVTDPDGVAQINGVYADFYYPNDRAFHPEDPSHPDQIDGGTPAVPDYGLSGCGEQVGDELSLTQLSKADGIELFCNQVRNYNNNLPTWYSSYDYDEVCAADGELEKEDAYVYCGDRDIIWEDPAGDYLVEIFALDDPGNFSNTLTNYFEYLPLTAYETDFTLVDYGNVSLNVQKNIAGDLTWGTSDRPSVRNLGNTRLYMGVVQDDMDLGTTGGVYNVSYRARVGNEEADWSGYVPYDPTTWLEDILDLSEIEEMDFSILVTKFPNQGPFYGQMTLSAMFANFRECFPS
ncbi:hypothetical protein KKF32_02815 [Patescibacteria group bacterium]|nr:hypothetical protein [Patescibacteria group bacterium]